MNVRYYSLASAILSLSFTSACHTNPYFRENNATKSHSALEKTQYTPQSFTTTIAKPSSISTRKNIQTPSAQNTNIHNYSLDAPAQTVPSSYSFEMPAHTAPTSSTKRQKDRHQTTYLEAEKPQSNSKKKHNSFMDLLALCGTVFFAYDCIKNQGRNMIRMAHAIENAIAQTAQKINQSSSPRSADSQSTYTYPQTFKNIRQRTVPQSSSLSAGNAFANSSENKPRPHNTHSQYSQTNNRNNHQANSHQTKTQHQTTETHIAQQSAHSQQTAKNTSISRIHTQTLYKQPKKNQTTEVTQFLANMQQIREQYCFLTRKNGKDRFIETQKNSSENLRADIDYCYQALIDESAHEQTSPLQISESQQQTIMQQTGLAQNDVAKAMQVIGQYRLEQNYLSCQSAGCL